MYLGRIEGTVWASVKDERLDGVRLCILQPVDEGLRPWGDHQVAVDLLGLTDGDLVFWVDSTEAGFVHDSRGLPTEISVVGLVDRLDLVEDGVALEPAVREPGTGAGRGSRRRAPRREKPGGVE
ncbi:MAG: hypothetical protein Kow00109_21860 [Acidobacteriota bacterium]